MNHRSRNDPLRPFYKGGGHFPTYSSGEKLAGFWLAYGIILAVSIFAPFINQYFLSVTGTSLNFVYILSASMAFFILLVSLSLNIKINSLNFFNFLILVVLLFINVNTSNFSLYLKPLLGLFLAMPFVFSIASTFSKGFYIGVGFFVISSLGLLMTNIEGLLKILTMTTRNALGNSPLSVAVICGCGLLWVLSGGWRWWYKLMFALPTGVLMFATSSRGPLLSLGAVWFIQMILKGARGVVAGTTILILGGCGVLYLSLTRANAQRNADARLEMYRSAMEAIDMSPFGLGRFNLAFFDTNYWGGHPHNLFLDLAVNANLFLALFFLYWLVLIIVSLVKNRCCEIVGRRSLVVWAFLFTVFCSQLSFSGVAQLQSLIPLLFAVIATLPATYGYQRHFN